MNKFTASIIGAALVAVITGCSSSAPKCADQKTIDLVVQIAKQEVAKAAGKDWADKVQFTLSAIRTTGTDDKTGAQKCAATMLIKTPEKEDQGDITYVSEKTDKDGQQVVTVYGL